MKKYLKTIGLPLLTFLVIFYGLNCDKKSSTEPEDATIIGTWKSSKITILAVDDVPLNSPMVVLSSPTTLEITVTLKEDSTFDFSIISPDTTLAGSGHWEESGGVIKISLPEELNMGDLEGEYTIEGDTLSVPTVQTFDFFGTGEAKYDLIIEFRKQ